MLLEILFITAISTVIILYMIENYKLKEEANQANQAFKKLSKKYGVLKNALANVHIDVNGFVCEGADLFDSNDELKIKTLIEKLKLADLNNKNMKDLLISMGAEDKKLF